MASTTVNRKRGALTLEWGDGVARSGQPRPARPGRCQASHSMAFEGISRGNRVMIV